MPKILTEEKITSSEIMVLEKLNFYIQRTEISFSSLIMYKIQPPKIKELNIILNPLILVVGKNLGMSNL